jgi:hypothetical protein
VIAAAALGVGFLGAFGIAAQRRVIATARGNDMHRHTRVEQRLSWLPRKS